MGTLYIFIDESGNFDFSSKGTRYFVLTSVSTVRPAESRERFIDLKYQLLKDDSAKTSHFFHATEDRQIVRDRIFKIIAEFSDIAVDAVVICKDGGDVMNPSPVEDFYRRISSLLLAIVFQNSLQAEIDDVVIILGALFTRTKQELVLKSLKLYLKEHFRKPFYIYFHPVSSDINCQIADYCGWAIYISRERSEMRPFRLIERRIRNILLYTNDHPAYPAKLRREPEGSC